MDISNANTFKVKLYFEACWDAARANKLAEFTGAATYDKTEKSFKRKGDIWGLLGVKDYNNGKYKVHLQAGNNLTCKRVFRNAAVRLPHQVHCRYHR